MSTMLLTFAANNNIELHGIGNKEQIIDFDYKPQKSVINRNKTACKKFRFVTAYI